MSFLSCRPATRPTAAHTTDFQARRLAQKEGTDSRWAAAGTLEKCLVELSCWVATASAADGATMTGDVATASAAEGATMTGDVAQEGAYATLIAKLSARVCVVGTPPFGCLESRPREMTGRTRDSEPPAS